MTYNTSSFPSLLKTLIALLNPDHIPQTTRNDSSRKPLLLLAYKERDPAERELWGMLAAKGVEMVLVDTVQGAEGDRGETEIWVGRYVGPTE